MTDNFNLLKEYLILGHNVFLTGPGGTGKTTMINKLRNKFDMSITSTTGVSSYNIQGRTIHSFSGIGAIRRGEKLSNVVKKIKKNKPAIKRIIDCKILVIDEISMLGKEYLEMIDQVFRYFRENETVFGGIQVIFTGDFLQLPPVNDDFCFESEIWESLSLKTIKLTTLYRFTDQKYSEILERVRTAQHTCEDNKELFKRFFAYKDLEEDKMEIKPTYLYGRKVNVEEKNLEELKKNENRDCVFYRKGFCKVPELETIIDNIVPKFLHLKINTQVMLCVNLNVEEGLVNGSRGVVVDIDEKSDNIVVKFLNGKIHSIPRHPFKYEEDGVVVYEYEQFPLVLAYALSIHKVQGCTLDCAVIDLGYGIFEDSMAYVALSRVRSLDGLFLTSYKPEKIKVNQKVLQFYESHL